MKLTEIVQGKADLSAVSGDTNYLGYFSTLSGSVAVGEIVSWSGFFWKARVEIASVTTSEPSGMNGDWCKLQPDIFAYTVSQLANGVYEDVGYICAGEEVSDYEYMIYPMDGRLFVVGNTTGIISGDFDPTTGIDSGLTGELSRYVADGALILENYLKGNQNLNVEANSFTLPSSTAQSYTTGDVFSHNFEAVTDIVDMTLIDGVVDGVSGTYRRKYSGDFSSSFGAVQLSDGSTSQTGVTVTYDTGSDMTFVDVELGVAQPHLFALLATKECTCPIINDENSLYAAKNALLASRVKVELNGSSMRSGNVVYTNTDPVDRVISVSTSSSTSSGSIRLYIDSDEEVAFALGDPAAKRYGVFAIIPAGSEYEVQTTSLSISSWYETGVTTNG